jgi:hypothetical protein
MNQSRVPKLFDLVAVVSSPAGSDLAVGDVGTVVEVLTPDGLEVEFLDQSGRTISVTTLNVKDVLVLNRERTKVA